MDITHVSYLRWIPLLPLLGAAVNGLGGAKIQRRFGKSWISALAVAPVLLAFVFSVAIGSLHANIAFWVDPLSCTMILVVTGIGGLIHIYSTGYMHEDDAYWRFFAYLNLFTFAMLTLVLGDSLLLMFVGWEGVGLCSFALIGFWWREQVNTTAGNKAFIVNRVGDFGFILGIFLIFWTLDAAGHGSVVFREIQEHAASLEGHALWGVPVVVLATLFLFVGATGKSAQIPLYVWLPDAMQGPTPVSALIHAATMVTAGVYMIARLNFLYVMAPQTLAVVAGIGAATALFAATIGLVQNDIKRVLAYSTVSQLGYMFVAMGVGAFAAGIFHLVTHAFFKACLFLGSGSVIHGMSGEQDMRKMGGLKDRMPTTFWTFLIATMAIAGTPLTAGFFSKDEILWKAYSSPFGGAGLWIIGVAGAGMTACYMFRQVFMTFFGETRADHEVAHHIHESPRSMTVPLIILAAGSILVGFLGVPEFLGGSNRFEQWLEPVFAHAGAAAHGAAAAHEAAHASHDVGLEWTLMLASVAIAATGFVLAYLLYYRKTLSADAIAAVGNGAPYRVLLDKYYVDELYWAIFVRGTLLLSAICAWFDATIVDGIVNGAARLTVTLSWLDGLFDDYVVDKLVNVLADRTYDLGARLRRVQTGNINAYLYVIVGAVTIVLLARLM
ncbi:MAG: NADH-quinone oxidoreductase subunit L [Deltaproteobacteria bacterium]|nr:MAG: NADH-quinone oxidoreductase subunit L [Deltaproteobacteria bacterium]